MERALLEARKDLEWEAQKKADKSLQKEKQRMQKEIDALQKGKEKADDEKRLAEEACLAAENAKSIADKEKELAAWEQDELQAAADKRNDAAINNFLKRLQWKQTDSDTDSDNDGDGQPRTKRSRPQLSEFDPDGVLINVPKYEGQNLHGLVLFKRVSDDIRRLIGRNEFFPLEKMYTGE